LKKHRHRHSDPRSLRERRKHLEDETEQAVTPEQSLRGNPKMQTLQRQGNTEKVANLEREGSLERVKPIFLVEKL
jgi:hypothetical protein